MMTTRSREEEERSLSLSAGGSSIRALAPTKWKDSTGYSRDDSERIPTTWTLDHGGLRITITSGHLYYRGTGIWVMHCRPWFDTRELKSKTMEAAQAEALQMVWQKIAALYAAFSATPSPASARMTEPAGSLKATEGSG